MHKLKLLITVTVAVCWGAAAFAQEDQPEPMYRFDPVLSGTEPRQTPQINDPQQIVVIENGETETKLRLQTETSISPYVGAERAPELSPEERRLLPQGEGGSGLLDYKLEAGVGLHVEDKASLNLGYRFQHPPSLLDERRNDPLPLSGDLRVTFDIKVPFD